MLFVFLEYFEIKIIFELNKIANSNVKKMPFLY